ncbi:hypothetical protein PC116_g29508 [Phytophthora cactorum]|nr:hypothetical protein PC116_g29508 [Phytophthora cactorum]
MTALQAAASQAHVGLVKRLVHMGADVNAPGSEEGRETALRASCELYAESKTERANMIEVIQFLIKEGADVNAISDSVWSTALHTAAYHGDLEVAVILIQSGADVNPAPQRRNSEYRQSPLDSAVTFGRLDMVQFLLSLGALSHHRGETGYDGAIEAAERWRYFDIANLIRQHYVRLGTQLGD